MDKDYVLRMSKNFLKNECVYVFLLLLKCSFEKKANKMLLKASQTIEQSTGLTIGPRRTGLHLGKVMYLYWLMWKVILILILNLSFVWEKL